MRFVLAIFLVLATRTAALARDWCANLDRTLDILQIQVGSASSLFEETQTEKFNLDTYRNHHATMDVIECWKLGGIRDENAERAIDGLIVQLKGKLTVGLAAHGLSVIGKPALRALPDLRAALEHEQKTIVTRSMNGAMLERTLISVVDRMTKLSQQP